MIESIYARDGFTVEVLNSQELGPFILQTECISDNKRDDGKTKLVVAYTKDGNYIGSEENARWLLKYNITEHVQPHSDGKTCSIGFNPVEQKWYGWSHRAIYGFGIGSTVEKGDCAYSPVDKKDLEEWAINFWDIGVVRKLDADRECKTSLVIVEHDAVHEEYQGVGMLVKTKTEFNFNREPYESTHFHEYPKQWGRGEWTARTMADAKQMAIDFAESVS